MSEKPTLPLTSITNIYEEDEYIEGEIDLIVSENPTLAEEASENPTPCVKYVGIRVSPLFLLLLNYGRD